MSTLLSARTEAIRTALDRFIARQRELERALALERRDEIERDLPQLEAEPPALAAHARRVAQAADEARDRLEPLLVEVWGGIETLRKDEFRLSADGLAWREMAGLEAWLAQAHQTAAQSSLDAAWLGFGVEQARVIVERLRRRRPRDLIAVLQRAYESGTPELRFTFQDHAAALITSDEPAAQAFRSQLARDRQQRVDHSPAILQVESEREALAHMLLDAYRQTRRAVSLLGTDTLHRHTYLGNVLKGVQIECRYLDGDRVALIFSRRSFGGSWFGGKGAPVQPVPIAISVPADWVRTREPGIVYWSGPA